MSKLVKNNICLIFNCSCKNYKETIIVEFQKDWVRIENPKDNLGGPEGCGPGVLTIPVGDSCHHHWGDWIPVRQKPWYQPQLYHAICRTCHITKAFEPERGRDV